MLNGGHRFLTHSLIGLWLFGFAAHWFLQLVHPITGSVDLDLVWRAFMLGMISHLITDTLTKEGVPWLLPIPIKFGVPPLKRLRITTGKAGETLLVFPLLILFNIVFYFAHYQQLLNILHHHIT
jgi:inner membrane protein